MTGSWLKRDTIEMMKYRKKIIFITITGTLGFMLVYYAIFEPISVDWFVINLTKRIAAEAGGIRAKIYDPYKSRKIDAPLGPVIDANLSVQKRNSRDFYTAISEGPLKDRLRILKYENKPLMESAFNFSYQPYNEKKLDVLRERYRLSEIISPAKNEFEKIRLISNWVNSRWETGKPQNIAYNCNALDILERAEKGEMFSCSEYVPTYIQLLASLGITARYVGLLKGHVVSEVWSDDFDKWVVIDPTFNRYFEKNGIPLNALELHNAYVSKDWKGITVVWLKPPDIEDEPIPFYENFFIRMRNDWFTNIYPRWHPMSNSIMSSREWSDGYTKNDIRIANKSNKAEELYWPLNHVYIKLISQDISREEIILRVYLDTITPNFDKFLITIDANQAVNSEYPVLEWRLHKGLNTLEAASLNKFGIKGPPTLISISYSQSDDHK